jgi:hypothetical protein
MLKPTRLEEQVLFWINRGYFPIFKESYCDKLSIFTKLHGTTMQNFIVNADPRTKDKLP